MKDLPVKDLPVNDSDDLGGLRTVLRQRADLAPDPMTILDRTQTLVRRRRNRRRTTGLLAAVAVTIGGLSSAALLGHGTAADRIQGAAPVLRTVVPAPTPVTPPEMPFTVGAVPAGYSIDAWNILPGQPDTVQYTGKNDFQTIVVSWSDTDPALTESNVGRTTVDGHPAVIGSISQQGTMRRISWPVPGGHWLGVIGDVPVVGEQNLRLVAGSITLRPSAMPASLRFAPVPAGIGNAVAWFGGAGPAAPTGVTLCRAGITDPNSPACVSVTLSTGTAPAGAPGKIAPGAKPGSQPPIPLHSMTVGTVRLLASDPTELPHGGVVERQIDPGHWVSVTSAGVDLETLYQVAIAAGVS